MEPHIVLLANVGDRINGIERAQDSGAAGTVDIEWSISLSHPLSDQPIEFVWPHSAAFIAGNLDHIVYAKTASGAGSLARVVALNWNLVLVHRLEWTNMTNSIRWS